VAGLGAVVGVEAAVVDADHGGRLTGAGIGRGGCGCGGGSRPVRNGEGSERRSRSEPGR